MSTVSIEMTELSAAPSETTEGLSSEVMYCYAGASPLVVAFVGRRAWPLNLPSTILRHAHLLPFDGQGREQRNMVSAQRMVDNCHSGIRHSRLTYVPNTLSVEEDVVL
jgi:hypothetical protein